MEKIELHFFHGFLGLPEDFEALKKSLSHRADFDFVFHNLWEDLASLDMDDVNVSAFKKWVDFKVPQLNTPSQKVLVGYSLGGRLLMQLPFQKLSHIHRVFYIASHAGLDDENEKLARRAHDKKWGQKFLQEDWEKLIHEWNSQEVFQGSSAPAREESRWKREKLSWVLENFSLGLQSPGISGAPESVWVYGDRDEKFGKLAPLLSRGNPSLDVLELKKSGHRCHLDNPEGLAELICSRLAPKGEVR